MAKGKKRKAAPGDIATNRQASHRYELLDRVEAGLVLQGTEVKALRAGSAQLKDAYASVRDGELWLHNLHIPPYGPAARDNHEPERPRKLLVHKREIERLDRQDAGARADDRPDAPVLQRPPGQGRDRARPRQGPLRQARVDQVARAGTRHGAGAARRRPLTARRRSNVRATCVTSMPRTSTTTRPRYTAATAGALARRDAVVVARGGVAGPVRPPPAPDVEHREERDQQDDRVRSPEAQTDDQREAHEPHPRGHGREGAAPVERRDGQEVEEVQEEPREGERQQQVAAQPPAGQRDGRRRRSCRGRARPARRGPRRRRRRRATWRPPRRPGRG